MYKSCVVISRNIQVHWDLHKPYLHFIVKAQLSRTYPLKLTFARLREVTVIRDIPVYPHTNAPALLNQAVIQSRRYIMTRASCLAPIVLRLPVALYLRHHKYAYWATANHVWLLCGSCGYWVLLRSVSYKQVQNKHTCSTIWVYNRKIPKSPLVVL